VTATRLVKAALALPEGFLVDLTLAGRCRGFMGLATRRAGARLPLVGALLYTVIISIDHCSGLPRRGTT